MLPILRIIPVGGVLLAIAILVLALNPPAGPHVHFTSAMTPARGALIARGEHPEWRQFLILAALRRADELSKLRDLPDTPTRTAPLVRGAVMQPAKPEPGKAPDAGQVAGVQPNLPDQEDITGTVQSPDAAIPVDIGESSSAELPVIPHQERPPVMMMPAREIPPPGNDAAPRPEPQPESRAAPEPAKTKQASREVAPQPAQPKQESKAAAPEPANAKQASREVAPARAEPSRRIRHVVRQRAKPRRKMRLARRARRVRTEQPAQFNLFQALFGIRPEQPGGHVAPTSTP
jgi:hypothetical protein